MKKTPFKTIIIILFVCFILLPVSLKLFGVNMTIFEGMEDEYSDDEHDDNHRYWRRRRFHHKHHKEQICHDVSYGDISNCPIPEPVKCIADFGTDVGDQLCCGQSGVLQDTRYVCPNNMPTCSNFKCGSAFGTCMNSD